MDKHEVSTECHVLKDATGYDVTTVSQEALEWFNKGIVAYITTIGDFDGSCEKSLELDPEILLIHCVLVSSSKPQPLKFVRKLSWSYIFSSIILN